MGMQNGGERDCETCGGHSGGWDAHGEPDGDACTRCAKTDGAEPCGYCMAAPGVHFVPSGSCEENSCEGCAQIERDMARDEHGEAVAA